MKKSIFSLLVIGIIANTMHAQVMNGLKAYYPFGGNAQDAIASNHGILIGSPTLTTDRFGSLNCAYEFPGDTSNYIKVNYASLFDVNSTTDSFTISLWYFDIDSSNNGDWEGLFVKGGFFTPFYVTNDDYFLALYDLNKPLYGSNNINQVWSPTALAQQQWHHLVVTSYGMNTGALVSLYLDGVQQAIQNSFQISQSMGDIKIGPYFSGKIDDIRFYDRALSTLEIDSLYNAPSSCLGVGISEQADLNAMQVFPNPTSQNLTIALAQAQSNTAYTLTDLQGRIVMQGRLQGLQTTLNVQELAKGMYVLQVGDQRKSVIVEY